MEDNEQEGSRFYDNRSRLIVLSASVGGTVFTEVDMNSLFTHGEEEVFVSL